MLKEYKNKYIVINRKESIIAVFKAITIVSILNYSFYKSLWAFIPLSVIGFIYFKIELKNIIKERKNQIRNEFIELLLLSTTKQRAGFSVENSIISSYEDLKRMYGDDSFACRLIYEINSAVKNNRSVSDIFRKVGESVEIADIELFGEIYTLAYLGAGKINDVMEKTATSIISKLEMENDIYMELNERLFEMKIMSAMPFVIMLYVSITNKGYFNILYHNYTGVIVMSICLGIYLLAYAWSNKLMQIEVA